MVERLFTKTSINLKLNIFKNIWLLVLLLLVGLNGNAEDIFINDNIATIVNNLNPHQTLQEISLAALHFIKAEKRRINFGLTGCEYHYLILKLDAPQTLSDQYLSMDNTSLDTVSIYRVYPSIWFRTFKCFSKVVILLDMAFQFKELECLQNVGYP